MWSRENLELKVVSSRARWMDVCVQKSVDLLHDVYKIAVDLAPVCIGTRVTKLRVSRRDIRRAVCGGYGLSRLELDKR
jgi:hypothetical protein